MKSLMIYYRVQPSSQSLMVEIENGVTRKVDGKPALVVRGMNADDLGVLVAFCKAVVATVENPLDEAPFTESGIAARG